VENVLRVDGQQGGCASQQDGEQVERAGTEQNLGVEDVAKACEESVE
jgi:hypothetical protein